MLAMFSPSIRVMYLAKNPEPYKAEDSSQKIAAMSVIFPKVALKAIRG